MATIKTGHSLGLLCTAMTKRGQSHLKDQIHSLPERNLVIARRFENLEWPQGRQVSFSKPLETLSEMITSQANSEMGIRDFCYEEDRVDILSPFSRVHQTPGCCGPHPLGKGGEKCQSVRPQDPWQALGDFMDWKQPEVQQR